MAPLPSLDPAELDRLRPDAHWTSRNPQGHAEARCSLWWRDTPALDGKKVGCIGQFAAMGSRQAGDLLEEACAKLAMQGCQLAVGPMDGSTWNSYRLVTGGSEDPPFFLEPSPSACLPEFFTAHGFAPLAHYWSSKVEDLDASDPKGDRALASLDVRGITVRAVDPSKFEEELRGVFLVTRKAFQRSFLYQPVSEPEFLAANMRLTPVLNPGLVLLAEYQGKRVGYVFAVPDLNQARRGVPVDTVIIKTLAILPGREYSGLGVALVRQLHLQAHAMGFRSVIHALMHQANSSRNISRANAAAFRQYTLFARSL